MLISEMRLKFGERSKIKEGLVGMQLLRFAVVGLVNTLIDFGVLNVLILLLGATSSVGLLLCNGVAFLAANLNSYFLNKGWTFDTKTRGSSRQYLLFLGFSLGGLALNSMILYLLTDALPISGSLSPFVRINGAKACATSANMLWNYLIYKQFIFRGKDWTAPQFLP